ANVGTPAVRVLASIAGALGDAALVARAAVAIALRESDDDEAVIDADAAVRIQPDLGPRLARRVSPARRIDALTTAARARAAEGAPAAAAALLERAVDLADDASRAALEGELRAAWDAAGRSAEIEARVQRDAASENTSPSTRADHWMEIAERREARGDHAGALRAIVEATKLDP